MVALGQGCDLGHDVAFHPVGADLQPHRHRHGRAQLLLERVARPQPGMHLGQMPHPVRRLLLRQQTERTRPQAGCGRGGTGVAGLPGRRKSGGLGHGGGSERHKREPETSIR